MMNLTKEEIDAHRAAIARHHEEADKCWARSSEAVDFATSNFWHKRAQTHRLAAEQLQDELRADLQDKIAYRCAAADARRRAV